MYSYRVHVTEGLFDQVEEACLPGTELISVAGRRLRDWWWAAAARGGIPPKRSFDVLDHFDAAPDLFLVEVLPGGAFRNKIVGERARSAVEPGRPNSIVRPDDARGFMRVLHRHYAEVVASRCPRRCTGRLRQSDRGPLLFEGLDCPLSSDGATVTHLIGLLTILRDAPSCLAGR